MWNISNSTATLNNDDGVLLTHAVDGESWYKARVDFNWTGQTFNGTLYDSAGNILDYSTWSPMCAEQAPEINELEYINMTTIVGDKCWIAFDGFTLNKAGYEDAEYGSAAWWTGLLIVIMLVLLLYWVSRHTEFIIDAKVLIGIAIAVITCLALIMAML